mgnify:CR=1 FL=1
MVYEIENNNSKNAANLITSGVTVTGRVTTPIDYDVYKIFATAGTVIEFTFQQEQYAGGGYSKLSFSDSLGQSISGSTGYGSSNESFLIKAPSTGFVYATVSGQSSSRGSYNITAVNDTSVSAATYSLSNNSYSVNEGSTASFTLTTKNLASGTSVPYTLSGVSSADVSGGLSGTAVVNSSGVATISATLLNDNLTEGAETLTLTAGGASASTVVNDTSNLVATYSISNSHYSQNEGNTALFILSTKNVAYGTPVPYTLSGISSADILGDLSGIAIVNSYYGQTIIKVTLLNDNLTEGAETLTLTAGGASASIVVNDTSVSAATYSLSNNSYSVNEGSTASFTLTTKNLASGTSVPYTLSGVSSADVSGGLSGTAVVNSSGVATISATLLNDNLTEGAETLTLTAGGASASTVVNDTSVSAATYSLSNNSYSVNEGSTASFTLTTKNLASGTSVPYTLSGVSSADVSGGLSGTAVVNSSGVATISATLLNDNLTEGAETLTVTAVGASASTVVNDTSKQSLSSTTRNFEVTTREARALVDNLGVDDPVDMFAGVTNWATLPAGGRSLPVIGETLSGDVGLFSIPALDPEGEKLTFTITQRGEGDSSLFTMLPGTNQFRFRELPDFNNPKDGAFVDERDPSVIISTAGDNLYTVEVQASGYGTTYAVIVESASSSGSTGSVGNDTSNTPAAGNTLDVIVDLFGTVSMLKGLSEINNGTVHTLTYNGHVFNYAEVDSLLTTVVRNGEFTAEFAQEIADSYPTAAGITYNTVVSLVGAADLDNLLIAVAGADGSYVS